MSSLIIILRRFSDAALVAAAIVIDLLVWGEQPVLRSGALLPPWAIPATTIVVYGSLLLRWRNPLSIFSIQWLYGFIGLAVPGYEPFMGLLVALHAVAVKLPARTSIVCLIACAVPFGINTYNATETASQDTGLVSIAISGAAWATLATVIWGLGALSHVAQSRADRIQNLQAAEAVNAIQDERLRLARELHDIVAHSVSVMILQAAGAKAIAQQSESKLLTPLNVIESSGVQAMSELHRLLGLLRAADSDEIAQSYEHQPTLEDLPSLIDLSRQAGLNIEVTEEGERHAIDPSVELAAYRVIQEALTNARKHAGVAASARVSMQWTNDDLRVTVRNDAGLGSPPASDVSRMSSGYGLKGLKERVCLTGGMLEAGESGGGFIVRAVLPLSPLGHGPANVLARP